MILVKKSRDRTGKRDTSEAKREQVHREEIAAFRRSMHIQLRSNSQHDPSIPDPIAAFTEIDQPTWWNKSEALFRGVQRSILHNIEAGKWKEPTPIQMQAIPTLLDARRDFIGAAPTGSGKSGAFLVPALFLASAPYDAFYGTGTLQKQPSRGEIRALILAPSLELAAQLHREVQRLAIGKPGGISALLLSKANAPQLVQGTAGGKNGVDVLVATPLRLIDCLERKGLKLDTVRLVVLDEADRLLDATDGGAAHVHVHRDDKKHQTDSDSDMKSSQAASGSTQSQTFLSQMDVILHHIPATAVRALFSATVTPMVRQLSESILRNPVDVTIAATSQGGANPDIDQKLMFVGREEGKLLAIRQLATRGELRPPVLVFVQSQERAQALFGELLYDGLRVDVIHAGRSRAAREHAVAQFRRGDTWVLICTDLVARGVDFRAVNMVINYDLPSSGVTYVHRIGRTGRAGRPGVSITLFTEADFENLRTIANVMKQSGCDVQDWMLNLPKQKNHQSSFSSNKNSIPRKRYRIDTTPSYDKKKRSKKKQIIQHSKEKNRQDTGPTTTNAGKVKLN